MSQKIITLTIALLLAITPALTAQNFSSPPAGAPLPLDQELEAPFVDLSNAMQAYRLVNNWLEDAKVPENSFELPRISVTNLLGIRVTLRSAGETFGQGTAFRANLNTLINNPGQAYDLAPLLSLAASDAFTHTRRKIINDRIDAVAKGWINADEPTPTFEDIAADLQVDIQIAHELAEINLTGQKMPQSIYTSFAPGFHGLRLTNPSPKAGDKSEAFIWPNDVLINSVLPKDQISRLLINLGLSLHEQNKIGQPNGLDFQRFDVIQFVQPQPGLEPVNLVRGNVLLPPHGIGDQDVRNLADDITEHLQTLFTQDNQVRGDFFPVQNVYKPAFANKQQSLLASYAVLRYHRHLLGQQDTNPIIDKLADLASNTAELIAEDLVKPDAAPTSVELALALMNVIQSPRASLMGPTRDALIANLNACANPDGSYRIDADPESPRVEQPTLAFIAGALATTYEQQRTEALRVQTLTVLDHLWDQTQKNLNLSTLYWLALAHSRVDSIINPENDQQLAAALVDREQSLGNAIEKLQALQIISPPRIGPPDVIGAFELYKLPLDAAPDPSWNTAQILALTAIGLREPGMKESRDAFGWILTASLAARFIDQITFKPESTFYIPSPDRVVGAVRFRLWDNRIGIAPSAMSLIACTELLESLNTLKTQTH
ncbi:hypothetical protein KS4_02960 [Poriferisphaera corsica]|uniref:Uncharacterized protein n=1 Tax=Poriferisphaera corsica TaxID=2528020 RepID=A0A517YPW5_9BACT|nr:hypothetical protein [Poriferisphaera corsica]QDU32265.1 hypothetical protein KS4_02960 [Poriferisphaera corsica]